MFHLAALTILASAPVTATLRRRPVDAGVVQYMADHRRVQRARHDPAGVAPDPRRGIDADHHAHRSATTAPRRPARRLDQVAAPQCDRRRPGRRRHHRARPASQPQAEHQIVPRLLALGPFGDLVAPCRAKPLVPRPRLAHPLGSYPGSSRSGHITSGSSMLQKDPAGLPPKRFPPSPLPYGASRKRLKYPIVCAFLVRVVRLFPRLREASESKRVSEG